MPIGYFADNSIIIHLANDITPQRIIFMSVSHLVIYFCCPFSPGLNNTTAAEQIRYYTREY